MESRLLKQLDFEKEITSKRMQDNGEKMLEIVINYMDSCFRFLGNCEVQYRVEIITAQEILKQYIDGSSMRQFVFSLSCWKRDEPYELKKMIYEGIYEKLSNYLDEQTRRKHLPVLGQGQISLKIEVKSTRQQWEHEWELGKYGIPCTLLYFQGESKRTKSR